MMFRYLWSAIAAGLLTLAAVAVSVERGYAQNGGGLPQKGGWITVVGCLQRGLEKRLVLVSPTTDHVPSVTEPACSTPVAEPLLEVHDTHEYHLDESLIGRWVEMSGRLEHFDKHDDVKDPREFHMRTVRAVPVVVPRAAEIPPAREMPLATTPPPAAPAPIAPAETPATTTGTTGTTERLPHTASPLPMITLTSVVSLMGALTLRLARRRLEGRG